MNESKTYLLPRNTVLKDRYQIEKVLGEGKCHVLSVRAEGGVLVKEGEF